MESSVSEICVCSCQAEGIYSLLKSADSAERQKAKQRNLFCPTLCREKFESLNISHTPWKSYQSFNRALWKAAAWHTNAALWCASVRMNRMVRPKRHRGLVEGRLCPAVHHGRREKWKEWWRFSWRQRCLWLLLQSATRGRSELNVRGPSCQSFSYERRNYFVELRVEEHAWSATACEHNC